MAQYKIWTILIAVVILSLLSSASLTIASNITGCNATGITIAMPNTTSSGNLSSPNYPDWIPENSSCIWILTCPPGRLIKLYLSEVIFNKSNKNHSHLEIRDGEKASSLLIINITVGESKLNENNSVPVIYSSGQKLSLHLKKGIGETIGSMRFRIAFSYIKPGNSCSANNSEDENNNILLTAPFSLTTIAENLLSDVDCTWKITPSIIGILMNITLNIKNSLFCTAGNIFVFDGPHGPISKMKQNLCQEPASSFFSDVGLSFQLKSSNFSSVLQIQASEDDCIKEGTFYKTKNFEGIQNLSRTQCQRRLSIPSGHMYFRVLYLRLPRGCENNNVQVFEVHKHSNKLTLRAKFCETKWIILGSGMPPIVIFSGQALVKVQTEAAERLYGFKAQFFSTGRHIPVPLHCSQYNTPEQNANITKTDRNAYIGTPLSGGYDFPYPPGLLCRWIIAPTNVTENEQIKIKFLKFGFGKEIDDKDCTQDHVQIDFGDGRIKRYCKATGKPSAIYSGDAKTVNITFVSTPLFTGNYGVGMIYDVVPIVPRPSPSRGLSWTVIGVLIGVGCLLVACVVFSIYLCKRKRQHDRVMQRMTNEKDEQEEAMEDTLPEEEAMATHTPQGPPPPYTSREEDSHLMQKPTEDQPHPWFSPGTTIMEHSPRERRPEPEMESKM